jgi:hypothetical protein
MFRRSLLQGLKNTIIDTADKNLSQRTQSS